MLRPIDNWFLEKDEPLKSCLQFLRATIPAQNKNITESWKYGMPFYCYQGKMFCYLWVHKKYRQPYIGFVEGKHLQDPELIAEKRARMKILLIDPEKDIPLQKINRLIKEALTKYQP